jgi:hypothetical protein
MAYDLGIEGHRAGERIELAGHVRHDVTHLEADGGVGPVEDVGLGTGGRGRRFGGAALVWPERGSRQAGLGEKRSQNQRGRQRA